MRKNCYTTNASSTRSPAKWPTSLPCVPGTKLPDGRGTGTALHFGGSLRGTKEQVLEGDVPFCPGAWSRRTFSQQPSLETPLPPPTRFHDPPTKRRIVQDLCSWHLGYLRFGPLPPLTSTSRPAKAWPSPSQRQSPRQLNQPGKGKVIPSLG